MLSVHLVHIQALPGCAASPTLRLLTSSGTQTGLIYKPGAGLWGEFSLSFALSVSPFLFPILGYTARIAVMPRLRLSNMTTRDLTVLHRPPDFSGSQRHVDVTHAHRPDT